MYDVDRMHRHDLATHTSMVGSFRDYGPGVLFDALTPDQILDILDWMIFDNDETTHVGQNSALERILAAGGSKWKVGVRRGLAGLEERVPVGVQNAADEVITSSGQAGALLGEAWHAAFGRNPNPEEAYEKAIKAVEEAGARAVSPRNRQATLGTMIRDMKQQGDWALPLTSEASAVPVQMAQALWTGQESRHGGNNYRRPTQAEAESAVLLAVPLVQWFSSNTFVRTQGSRA